MYAIVESGGKQYRVEVGQNVDVERLEVGVGDAVSLDRVLLVADGENVRVGTPLVNEARVAATVLAHGRGPKLIVFHYRPKEHSRKKNGHRQGYTRLHIDAIEA